MREGEAEAPVSGRLAMPPNVLMGDRACRYRPAPQPESIARGATLFEASVTLWLANAPCLDFAGVAHGFMWSGPWAVSLKKDTFHGDYAPGSGPPQDSVGGGYAIEFKATQPSGSFALFRFPMHQPCAEQVTLAQYRRG